ncbi:MAG: FAD-binding protein, partial [Myxococcota bacterium]|nr:FAD-binding protein [Myxococcota bacterium]
MSRLRQWVQDGGSRAASRARERLGSEGGPEPTRQTLDQPRIVPGPAPTTATEEESLDVWGFSDTRFQVNDNGNVELTGTRYPLSGYELPKLLPWIEGVMQVKVDTREVNTSNYPPPISEPRTHDAFMKDLSTVFEADQLCTDARQRLRHGHGHTQEEMYAIKYGELARIPDLVVHPTEQEQVVALVEAAQRHDVCLIPYGGGTNVTNALRCPENDERMMVSVDMRRMNRILWIDPVDQMACIQAGAVGRHIVTQLAEHGYTLGHEPDSVEFSTLGGWVATHASGMKKNRYGNIEDIVLDVNVVTAHGTLSRTTVAPRESVGSDPRRWVLGSEGNLGIITQAVVKLAKLPEVQRYGSVAFPTFEAGMGFLYSLTRAGDLPASVRLVDNLQFQLSMALKPAVTGLDARKSELQKLFVTRVKGFETDEMVACTLVFEGGRAEVEAQEEHVYGLAARYGGLKSGSSNGERGYQLTFGIAYIRDFI